MLKKVMILEDNADTRDFLERLVWKISPDIEVLKFASMDGVYDAVMNSNIDLFLVDIILDVNNGSGDTSGLGFVEKIRGVQKYEFTPVIFITSLQDPKFYAFNHLHSYSFIEKPINPDYVEDTIRKALRFSNSNFNDPVLFLRKDGLIIKIQSSEIVYIESNYRKLYFHMNDGRVERLPYKPWKQIKTEIDSSDFVQCSRSVMVNKRYVTSIDLVNCYVRLKGIDEPVVIGVTYRNKVEKEFGYVG